MNKYLIQGFIILIIILLGVSLISENNREIETRKSIDSFEQSVSKGEEINNGNLIEVEVLEEDSSNLISDINAKIANVIVEGLNSILKVGIKIIDGLTN